MGFRFRRSVNLGPFRLTASKSGLGVSAGVKGLRVTKTASGRVRTTASIPGTGISYVEEKSVEGSKRKRTPQKSKGKTIGIVFFVLLVIGMIGKACGSDPAENPQPEPTSVAVSEAAAVRSIPAPAETPVPAETPSAVKAIAVTTPIPEPTPAQTPEPTPQPANEYVLNTNTMKFHKPTCSSVEDIKPENKQFVECTRSELIEQGYDPCGRCHP